MFWSFSCLLVSHGPLLNSSLLDLTCSNQLPIPSQHPIGIKNVAQSKRKSYRCHTRFKSPQGPRLCKINKDLGSWASLPSLLPHIPPLLHCSPKPPVVSVTCAQVFDIMWQESYWDWLLHGFLALQDLSCIMDIYSIFAQPNKDKGVVTVPLKLALFSSIESPYCLSIKTVNSSVIIDSGASVCISPHRSKLITYKDSKMKIKDLSSSNKVAGEGILRWKLQDVNGDWSKLSFLDITFQMLKSVFSVLRSFSKKLVVILCLCKLSMVSMWSLIVATTLVQNSARVVIFQ
jgi:hypothetical protein